MLKLLTQAWCAEWWVRCSHGSAGDKEDYQIELSHSDTVYGGVTDLCSISQLDAALCVVYTKSSPITSSWLWLILVLWKLEERNGSNSVLETKSLFVCRQDQERTSEEDIQTNKLYWDRKNTARAISFAKIDVPRALGNSYTSSAGQAMLSGADRVNICRKFLNDGVSNFLIYTFLWTLLEVP